MSSINHYYYTCSSPIPSSSDPHLWSSSTTTTTQQFDAKSSSEMGKMGMFEKALTPSDVGKLNRLVIPKQHAERYFPLKGGGGTNTDEKGLLLSFEDDEDKTWRFRYSYWNSSQSYVLTKGWSRFVKDKKLQAGDIVVFLRHRLDHDRLFIGWRRRSDHPAEVDHHENKTSSRRSKDVFCYPIPSHHEQSSTSDLLTQPHSTIHSPAAVSEVNEKQQQVAGSSGNCRKLRLFGVNLECQLADDESDDQVPNDQSPMFYQEHDQYYHYQQHLYSNYYNHMDSNLSGGEDVYRQR